MAWAKKALTPLMITLLLISLAVAIGVGVMNFGKAQVEEAASCPVIVGLKFAVIGGEEQYCYDGETRDLTFTVENGVNTAVTGLIVNVIGTERAESFELSEARVGKAATYLARITYDAAVGGEIRQVKISPKVTPYDEELICPEQALVIETAPPVC